MTEVKEVPLGMRELYPSPAQAAVDAIKEQGVEIAFGVHGGHFWAILDLMSMAGVRMISFHHEQSGVYAAEAYARITNKAGVCFATTGPGSANSVGAIHQAHLNCSPLVVILSGHESFHDMAYALQECHAEEFLWNLTKWVKRLRFPWEYKRYVTKAFKDALSWPRGPVALEFDCVTFLNSIFPPAPSLLGPETLYVQRWRGEETGKPLTAGGDPKLVEKAVKLIFEAKKPIIVAADGVHMSGGSQQLAEFAELAQVPVSGRRISRGALPEVHPLNLSSRIAGRVLPESDLVIALGMKVGGFDGYGRSWQRCIQINESPDHIWTYLRNTEAAIVGSPAVVLEQMIDCAKALKLKPPPERSEWTQRIYEEQRSSDEELRARAEKYKDHKPVHFGYLARAVWDACEELYGGMNRVVMDGYTISSYAPPVVKCRYSGQYIDCGEHAGVGHGIGMAIGAAFADPGAYKRPVVVFMGDSGQGLAGYDVETAARYKLPIVYIVTNNNGWFTGMKYLYYGKNWEAMGKQDQPLMWEFLPDLRYDKIGELMGCHGEHVAEPGQIRPAMERAFKAAEGGKPAVVNVIMDGSINNRECYSIAYSIFWGHIPWDKLPKRGKALRRNLLFTLPWDEAGVPPMPMPDPWEPVSEEELEP